MKSKKAAMQGEKNKVVCNLSRAGAARVHARRLARESRVMGGSTCCLGRSGWDSGGNKQTATAIELRLRTH